MGPHLFFCADSGGPHSKITQHLHQPHQEPPLPGVMDATQPSRCWEQEEIDDEGLASGRQELFHIDSDKMTCFNKAEAAAAIKHLDSMGFADQIISRLNSVHRQTRTPNPSQPQILDAQSASDFKSNPLAIFDDVAAISVAILTLFTQI